MISFVDHAEAVLELLDAIPLPIYEVRDGGQQTIPNAAEPPYVAVHMVPQRALGPTLEAGSTRMVMRIITHSVGANELAARFVSDQVAEALLGIRPNIAGRNPAPIRQDVGQDPRDDETTGVSVVTITESWRLETLPGVPGS